MSVIQALAYLWVRSARNRIWSRLRRFRQPKYLVGGIVGLLYLWTFFIRNLFGGHFGPHGEASTFGGSFGGSPELLASLEVAGAWGLLLVLAGFWVVPSRRAALDFSEAEVQFLFPAPVSRTGLLHYKLAGWQAGLLFTSLMVSLFSGRLLRGDGAWMSVIGWWLGLLLLQLHSLGASFVRTWLLERGVAHWQRRLGVGLLLAGAFLGALAWGWREAPPPPEDLADVEAMLGWWVAVSQTTPMAQLLAPLRWVARLVFTRDAGEFFAWIGPVLLLVVAHYFWVIRATVAFEEASVDAARAAMEMANRRVEGRTARGPFRGGSRAALLFPLHSLGVPWIGLAWKNLAGAGGSFRGRTLVWVGPLSVVAAGVGPFFFRGTAFATTVGSVALMLWVFSALMGPSSATMHFRRELGGTGWEILKALPLAGWQIVLGELMAPWCILTAIQWGLGWCVVAYLPAPPGWGEIGVFESAIALAGISIVGPAVSLVGMCLQNGAALLFPAWVLVSPGQTRGGFEVLGQRMIVYAGQMLGLMLAVAPAAVAAAVLQGVVGWFAGAWIGGGAAAIGMAAILLLESALAVRCLGWIWDRTDFSGERVGW